MSACPVAEILPFAHRLNLGSAVCSVIDAPDCCQKTQARFWVPKTPAPKVSHKVWYPPYSWGTVHGGSGQPAGPCVHRLRHPRGLLSGLHRFHSTENTSLSPGTEPMLINKTLEYSDLFCLSCCTRCFISHDLLFSQSLYHKIPQLHPFYKWGNRSSGS